MASHPCSGASALSPHGVASRWHGPGTWDDWGRPLPPAGGASTSANLAEACNQSRCFRHWVVARADPAAAPPLDGVIAMHTTIRRSIAAIALTALLSTTPPLRAGEHDAAPTAADEDFPEAAARIERASALQHSPVEHGLVGMQARFRYTTTMFVNDEAGKAVLGQVVWTKETGVLVKFDEESDLNGAANGPLMTLDSLLKGPRDAFKITPRDRVTSCTDSVIEVVAHAPSKLRSAGDSCGWVGAPTVRFTFDESGRVRRIRALGSPSAEARAAGAPDGIDTTMEWADGPSDRSSVITRMRMDFLTGCEGEQQAAPTTLYWLDNRIEYVELGDARVPSHLVMDICRGENEVLRRDELVFTEIAAHEAVPATGLEGFRPNDERDAPPPSRSPRDVSLPSGVS